ncbi:transposase domain-containing protein [Ramlibacter monticola]|uniref:Transposase domain-containing protein n=1 Tax=Ramlibacter monticola TaxID=1926872 RepID=A0A936Z0V4_9BURK|nr:transposase domain-containing protein [Ramlibacter monticola]
MRSWGRIPIFCPKIRGHDPHAHLRDVLQPLPEHPAGSLDDLLPHRW